MAAVNPVGSKPAPVQKQDDAAAAAARRREEDARIEAERKARTEANRQAEAKQGTNQGVGGQVDIQG